MDSVGILVGYDGSEAADVAVRWAARAALLRDEPVTALIVVDPVDGRHSGPGGDAWSREVEARAGAALRTESGDADVHVEIRSGPVLSTLLEAAEDASMLVLGSSGHHRMAELLLNSVSQAAARKTRIPLVVARSEPPERARRVTVGIDGSRPSLRALDFACHHAIATGADIHLVTAWRSGAAPEGAHGTGVLLSSRVHPEQDVLDRVVTQARAAHPALVIEPELVHRDAGRALVDASAASELVVVGCQGLTALEEVVLGSVSQYVLRGARCPVAVVH